MYAEVVVNLLTRRLDRVFHYQVPHSLREVLKEGMQVLVPFGGQTVDGYIVGFTDSPDVEKVKDIIDVVGNEPVFDARMLELARWVAKTYLCSLVDALHLVMPPGLKLNSKKVVYLNKNLAGELVTELENSHVGPLFRQVWEGGGKTDLKELEQRFPKKGVTAFINLLKVSGAGGVTSEFRPKVRKRKVRQVCLAEEYNEDVAGLIEKLSKKAPKQAQVLNILLDEGQVSMPDMKEYGCSAAALKSLEAKGIIKISEVEDLRDPFAGRKPQTYPKHSLTTEQTRVFNDISSSLDQHAFDVFLLHGVTGSGKTEVYLQAIEKVLAVGKQAIFLVPEISLTPQMVERFRGRFGEQVAVLHSALSAGERYDQWRLIQAGLVPVVVGARSAVFAPVPNLGLIILDEEHETTYKQEDNPKYHAREVALFRAQQERCPVILGSATPSMESYYRAKVGLYKLRSMPIRVAQRPMPAVEIIDMRQELERGNRSIFSTSLEEKIRSAIDRKEQVILFLNRRGYSTFVVCRECGLVVRCRHCHVSMTYHAAGEKMICHYCGYKVPVPKLCPACQSKYIRYFGLGTQRVEEELCKTFPQARYLRMDVDTTTRKGAHEKILSQFAAGKADILIGTQMIAKGLDFPRVTVVGVIAADTSLNLPDFRSAERTFQLLTQVAGRAGRDQLPGTVVVQTYQPEHYSIQTAMDHDYLSFYQTEEEARCGMEYPPFCQLLRIVISGFDENRVIQAAQILADSLLNELRGIESGLNQPLLGPAPAPLTRLRNKYRWQICIKALDSRMFRGLIDRSLFISGLREQFSELGFNVEVDPQSLL